MKVQIGGIHISDVSFDDLDELVRRYGQGVEPTEPNQRKSQLESQATAPMPLRTWRS